MDDIFFEVFDMGGSFVTAHDFDFALVFQSFQCTGIFPANDFVTFCAERGRVTIDGVDYTLLASEELCCGLPLKIMGDKETFDQNASEVMELIKAII